MLELTVGDREYFDEDKEEFVRLGGFTVQLEHSLVSLSKWESKFEKPFLTQTEKTDVEALSYVECMVISKDVPENFLTMLEPHHIERINSYIDAKMSATWFNEQGPQRRSSEAITAELIYYWMLSFQIPAECENWHLNRLFNLIKICSIKNAKPKKMSKAETVQRQRELNAQRRAQMGTTG